MPLSFYRNSSNIKNAEKLAVSMCFKWGLPRWQPSAFSHKREKFVKEVILSKKISHKEKNHRGENFPKSRIFKKYFVTRFCVDKTKCT